MFHIVEDEKIMSTMEGKTDFSRRLKQFDGLTRLTLTSIFYDRSVPLNRLIMWLGSPVDLRTCDQQVARSTAGRCAFRHWPYIAPRTSRSQTCASVTKQYNLVPV